MSQCLYTSSRIRENEWTFVYKIVGRSLSIKCKWFIFFIYNEINSKTLNERRNPMDFKCCSMRAVLFEASCNSLSRKPLSLIKIENCLLLFSSNTRSTHRRLFLQNGSFGSFNKVIKRSLKEFVFYRLWAIILLKTNSLGGIF